MSRSKWKKFFIHPSILKIGKALKDKLWMKLPKIWCRSSTIPSILIGKRVLVHDGKEFHRIEITKQKVGYKFGEFSRTRKLPTKKSKVKIKTKKLKK